MEPTALVPNTITASHNQTLTHHTDTPPLLAVPSQSSSMGTSALVPSETIANNNPVLSPTPVTHPVRVIPQRTASLETTALISKSNVDTEEQRLLPLTAVCRSLAASGPICTLFATRNVDPISGEYPLPSRALAVVVIGLVCGLFTAAYATLLHTLLRFLWISMPRILASRLPHPSLWIPMVVVPMSALVALPVRIWGDPGDLGSTIADMHHRGVVDIKRVLPMTLASQASIAAGGSLGPEAPLVQICGALGGYVSRVFFGATARVTLRKHTICGMASALAAFFGVPISGAVFAMEIGHHFGFEYYEHFVEALSSSIICLFVYRTITGDPIGAIWSFTGPRSNTGVTMSLGIPNASIIPIGAAIGLLGALTALLFAKWHHYIRSLFDTAGLLHPDKIFLRTALASVAIAIIGMLIPYTLFWGELEIQVVANGMAATSLPHMYQTTGLVGLNLADDKTLLTPLLIAIAKMVTISIADVGGYRGGFIFPLFLVGSSLGRGLVALFPTIPPAVATLSFAAGINTAITRTPLGTSLVLIALAGEPNAAAPIITAALVSLFLTNNLRFIATQQKRVD